MHAKWYTCTPISFEGGEVFFSRDSGLLCRGFQMLGIDCKVVMPLETRPNDDRDLIRVDIKKLKSVEWWREQNLDGVVLYAWGSPKYRNVASSIRNAGIRLILNQDNGGLVSPVLGISDWSKDQLAQSGALCFNDKWARYIKLLCKGILKGLLWDDLLRIWHLRQGDIITCVSPIAADHYHNYCRIYGGDSLSARVIILPHPVQPQFHVTGPKTVRVVAVGRWDDECQKRAALLGSVVEKVLQLHNRVEVEIVGRTSIQLYKWHTRLPDNIKNRIHIRGTIVHRELAAIYAASQVLYCPSAFESFHIASAEALCCGCTVVAARSQSLASFLWYEKEQCCTLARNDNRDCHAEAIIHELRLWESGRRIPEVTATLWQSRFHADKVAEMIIKQLIY